MPGGVATTAQVVGWQGVDDAGYGGRELSPQIWGDFPIERVIAKRVAGVFDGDDFDGPWQDIPSATAVGATLGQYEAYSSDGCSIVQANARHGVLTFTTDASNEGAAMARTTKPFQITQDAGLFCFECRVKRATIATADKCGFFIGLMDEATMSVTVPIAAAGTVAVENCVGFHNPETTDQGYFDTTYSNDSAVVKVKDNAVALVLDTWVKLGMRFDRRNANKLTFYKNGAALPDTKTIPNATGTDFPADVTMGFVAGILGAGTSAPTVSLDWWYAGQLDD